MSRPTRGPRLFIPVRGCHPLWPAFPDGSGCRDAATGLAPVRSPLLGGSLLMSFPPATEMFQFAGFASQTYVFGLGCRRSGGLPHSEIHGSKLAHSSPRLIAARHVLHRLSTPRHSPNALETLERAIVHASRQDIGRAKQRLPRSTQKKLPCVVYHQVAPSARARPKPRRSPTATQKNLFTISKTMATFAGTEAPANSKNPNKTVSRDETANAVRRRDEQAMPSAIHRRDHRRVVEPDGIEPTT